MKCHGRLGQYLNFKIFPLCLTKIVLSFYKKNPEPIHELENGTIFWDSSVNIDQTHPSKSSRYLTKDKRRSLIDFSINVYNKMSTKISKKRSKCKDPEIEIETMWHLKAKPVLVVVGVLGMI